MRVNPETFIIEGADGRTRRWIPVCQRLRRVQERAHGWRSIRVTCLEEPDAVTPHVRFCEGEVRQRMHYSTKCS